MGGLGRNANAASGGANNLANAITGGILQANLFTAAIGSVQNAVGLMMGKFEEAKSIEIGDVSAASTFSALTKQSFSDSTKFVSEFSKEISVIAGALPGATKDYNQVANSIMDNVIPAFQDANGVLDQGKFKENLVDITKKMTLLGVTSGTHSQAVGMFTARLLDGNIASAKQLLFADNNPAFMERFNKALERQGKTEKDFKKMTAKQRLEIVQAVSSEFIKDEVIEAAENTVEGILAGIESSIFDPKSGVFGLLRDLSIDEGNQTVMSAVAGGIKALQRFFGQIGELLTALGVPPIDPMLVLYNGINNVTGWITQASELIKIVSNAINAGGGGIRGLQESFDSGFLRHYLGKKLNNFALKTMAFLKPIFQRYLNPTLLTIGFQKLLNGFGEFINNFFAKTSNLSEGLVGENGAKLSQLAMGAGYVITKFIGDIIGKLAIFVINLPWADILITIGRIAIASFAVLASFLAGAMAAGVESVRQNTIPIIGSLLTAVWDGIKMLVIGVAFAITEGFQGITDYFGITATSLVTAATDPIQGFFSFLIQGLIGMWESLKSAITQAIERAKNTVLQVVTQQNPNTPTNPVSSVVGTASTLLNPIGSLVNGAANQVMGANLWRGRIPTAANGMLGALATESSQMPSGAFPVIANSSEFILTPAQMGRMMRGSATVGAQSRGNVTISPVFNISGNDAKAIASIVLAEIELLFNQYQDGVLA
jgi:hypothetical protein